MYYEINVSLNGTHFFATAERSITAEAHLRKVLNQLKTALPASQGYKVTVTKWEKQGQVIDIVSLLD